MVRNRRVVGVRQTHDFTHASESVWELAMIEGCLWREGVRVRVGCRVSGEGAWQVVDDQAQCGRGKYINKLAWLREFGGEAGASSRRHHVMLFLPKVCL